MSRRFAQVALTITLTAPLIGTTPARAPDGSQILARAAGHALPPPKVISDAPETTAGVCVVTGK
jgi:hypothetical protein